MDILKSLANKLDAVIFERDILPAATRIFIDQDCSELIIRVVSEFVRSKKAGGFNEMFIVEFPWLNPHSLRIQHNRLLEKVDTLHKAGSNRAEL